MFDWILQLSVSLKQGGNTLRRRNEAKHVQFLHVFGWLAVSRAYLNLINLVTSHGFISSRVVGLKVGYAGLET